MRIGFIGAGAMGSRCANDSIAAGHEVSVTDVPERISTLETTLGTKGIHVVKELKELVRSSELILLMVPVDAISDVAQLSAKYASRQTIFGGGCSVKTPEAVAFDYFLRNNPTFFFHSLYGPSVPSKGQTNIVMKHRIRGKEFGEVVEVVRNWGALIRRLNSYQEHDRITADTQAATHVCSESMAEAMMLNPATLERTNYFHNINRIKLLQALRPFIGRSHVFRGLAMKNPYADIPIQQFARSARELHTLAATDSSEYAARVHSIQSYLTHLQRGNKPLLLPDTVMGAYALSEVQTDGEPNSELSQLAMADGWMQLGISPYHHLVCKTPPFQLRLGTVEYFLRQPELVERAIEFGIEGKYREEDDLFCKSAERWAGIISRKDAAAYDSLFDKLVTFFGSRIDEAKRESDGLIARLAAAQPPSEAIRPPYFPQQC